MSAAEGRVLCLFAPGGFERILATGAGAEALADLAEAERWTRLVGPPLSSPSVPSQRGE